MTIDTAGIMIKEIALACALANKQGEIISSFSQLPGARDLGSTAALDNSLNTLVVRITNTIGTDSFSTNRFVEELPDLNINDAKAILAHLHKRNIVIDNLSFKQPHKIHPTVITSMR